MRKVDLVECVNPRTGEVVLLNRMFVDDGHWLPANPKDLTQEDVEAICGGDVDGVVRDLLKSALRRMQESQKADATNEPPKKSIE